MNKLQNVFTNKKALMVCLTCGDPDLESSAEIIRTAVHAGADLLQLNIPFSDPVAEGPVLQQSSVRSLRSGTTTDKIFDLVRDLRKEISVPIIFATYANVVFSYGCERFLSACKELAVDGLFFSDIPYEEKEEFLPYCREYGVALLSAIVPAPTERMEQIAKDAEGFLYLLDGCDPSSIKSFCSMPCVTDVPTAEADGLRLRAEPAELITQYGKNAANEIAACVKAAKETLNCL